MDYRADGDAFCTFFCGPQKMLDVEQSANGMEVGERGEGMRRSLADSCSFLPFCLTTAIGNQCWTEKNSVGGRCADGRHGRRWRLERGSS
jgi:hypothetical protein